MARGRNSLRPILAAALVLVALPPVSAQKVAFVDIAEDAGLRDVFRCGRDDRKDYILEALGGRSGPP